MSGPKVVRVVTREEEVADCLTLIAQLDTAVAIWEGEVQRLGLADCEPMDVFRAERMVIGDFLANDHFDQVRKKAPLEREFVVQKTRELRERATLSVAAAREQASQLRHSASTLLHELERRKHPLDEAMAEELGAIANGKCHSVQAERVLSKAFVLLTEIDSSQKVTNSQRELAKRLSDDQGNSPESWDRWMGAPKDPRVRDLNRGIAQIEVHISAEAASSFNNRLLALEREENSHSRDLKLDGLLLDVANALKVFENQRQFLTEALNLMATVDSLPSPSKEIRQQREQLAQAHERSDLPAVKAVSQDLIRMIEEQRRHFAAHARRVAVLKGLKALGYEVQEGMSTAWTEQGRIVLRRADSTDYGVELAATQELQRMQIRAVVFSAKRDVKRDRDVETTWCTEFAELRTLMEQQGGALTIEKALPIGATPLKTVAGRPAAGRGQKDPSEHGVNVRRPSINRVR